MSARGVAGRRSGAVGGKDALVFDDDRACVQVFGDGFDIRQQELGLAPRAIFVVKVTALVRSAAPRGASLTRTLRATSTTDTRRYDTVKFVTSRT